MLEEGEHTVADGDDDEEDDDNRQRATQRARTISSSRGSRTELKRNNRIA